MVLEVLARREENVMFEESESQGSKTIQRMHRASPETNKLEICPQTFSSKVNKRFAKPIETVQIVYLLLEECW